MTSVSLAELRALIDKHAGPDTRPLRSMPGIFLGIESAPTPPCQIGVEPVLSPAAQGASPSQFSREYRRMFGKPPARDGADSRANTTLSDGLR